MKNKEGFDKWWDAVGSGMPPMEGEDRAEYMRRVAMAAWQREELRGVFEIWVNNPNSSLGWVRHAGPFTSRTKTEKRVRDMKIFDSVKGCRFSIRSLPNVEVRRDD